MARQRQYSVARRSSRFVPRSRILIVCEGRVTEPNYIRELRHHERVRLVDIVINDKSGVPKTVVQRAVDLKREAEREARREQDSFLKFDEVWCVFDVDAHLNINDAIQQAKANGIFLAISNPCFELWILLHFQDQRAHLSRGEAQSKCREYLRGFEKLVPFREVHAKYQEALSRAKPSVKR